MTYCSTDGVVTDTAEAGPGPPPTAGIAPRVTAGGRGRAPDRDCLRTLPACPGETLTVQRPRVGGTLPSTVPHTGYSDLKKESLRPVAAARALNLGPHAGGALGATPAPLAVPKPGTYQSPEPQALFPARDKRGPRQQRPGRTDAARPRLRLSPTALPPAEAPPPTYSGSRSPRSGSSRGCSGWTARPSPRSGSSAATAHAGRHTSARCKS